MFAVDTSCTMAPHQPDTFRSELPAKLRVSGEIKVRTHRVMRIHSTGCRTFEQNAGLNCSL